MSRYRLIMILIVTVVLLTGLEPPVAGARTLAVPEDFPTITAALDAAQAGDFVLVGCGVYRERNLRLKSGVSLWSATLQPDCTVIDAQNRGRVLLFDGCDSSTAVVGLTLRGGLTGNDGGAVLCHDSSPRLTRCRLENSRARHGGALAVTGTGGPVLEDCVITGNTATDQGGGVHWSAQGSGRLSRCEFGENLAVHGGALAMAGPGDLLLEASILEHNLAGGLGGAVWIAGGALELRDCLLARNDGGLSGSALACLGTRPRLIGCTLVDNASDSGGAAVYLDHGSLAAERTLVAFNQPAALDGMAVPAADLSNCDIVGHPDGDWVGPVVDLAGRHWNFSADPLFCDQADGAYDLRSGSPCLPGGRPGAASVQVGARAEGCR